MPTTKMIPSSRKPPLANVRSPIRLRPRRGSLHSSSVTTLQNPPPPPPPDSLMKSKLSKSVCGLEELDPIRPDYQTISCELRALAKMVNQEFGSTDENGNISGANRGSPLFERGRFYEEYSARRNERLKRKKGETADDGKKPVYDLGVRVESAKRRGETKRFESTRKTMPSTPLTERREVPPSSRYSLRSAASKENKKPPLAAAISIENSAGIGSKNVVTVRRATRRI